MNRQKRLAGRAIRKQRRELREHVQAEFPTLVRYLNAFLNAMRPIVATFLDAWATVFRELADAISPPPRALEQLRSDDR